MPYLPDFTSALQYYQNQEPIKELTPGGLPSISDSPRSTAVPQAAPEATGSSTMPFLEAEKPTLRPLQAGGLSERILSPLTQGIQEAQAGTKKLTESFGQAAEPSRVYGADIQAALERALGPQAGSVEKKAAQGYLATSYQGPQAFNAQEEAALKTALQNLSSYAKGARGGYQLRAMVGQAIPGSTLGEQALEAQRLTQDQTYQGLRAQAESQTQEAEKQESGLARTAQEYAQQRQQEEADIARLSREFLVGKRTGVEADIQKEVETRTARQQALQDAYRSFLETGQLPPEELAPGGAGLEVGLGRRQAEMQGAKNKWDEIMARYPDVSGIPLLTPSTTKRYREITAFPQGWIQANQDLVHSPEWPKLYNRVLARQQELEEMFSPRPTASIGKPEGVFSKYKPLYFAGDENQLDLQVPTYRPPELGGYVTFDPGISPSRQNVSTKDQKQIINDINGLLGEADKLDESGDPYRAASITIQVQKYLEDEAANMAEWDRAPTEAAASWAKQVGKAREKLKDQKRSGLHQALIGLAIPGGGLFFTLPKAIQTETKNYQGPPLTPNTVTPPR